jgi:hypothetical protein
VPPFLSRQGTDVASFDISCFDDEQVGDNRSGEDYARVEVGSRVQKLAHLNEELISKC